MKKSLWLTIRLSLVAVIFVNCASYRLEHRLKEQVDKGRLTADLAVIALNHPALSCPKYSQGDGIDCPGGSLRAGDDYDASLPDMALFSMFFLQHQYDTVKDIIETPWFQQALQKVPDPDEKIMRWYQTYRSTFHTIFIPSGDSNKLAWTPIQTKLLTVFHNIQSWNFCPAERNTSKGIVHGIYKDRQITLYKTACNAGKIYGSNIKTLARSYRFFFIGSHELGHAIDNDAGQLDNSTPTARLESEMRANLSGLIMAKAVARLMYKMILLYENGMRTSARYKPLQYDELFIRKLETKGAKVERYFDGLLRDAHNDFTTSMKNKRLTLDEEWRGNFCLE